MKCIARRDLVLRVEIREKEADRHRRLLGVRAKTLPELTNQVVEVERHELGAFLIEPLENANAVGAAYERCRLLPREVVVALAVDPLDVGDVLETLRRDVHNGRTVAREHGVDPDRGSYHREVNVPGPQIGAL